jgi:hypothetical protein
VIRGVRGEFLKRHQEPAVTPALWAHDRRQTQRQWNQEVVWRGQEQETDPRNTQAMPEIRENASITRKRRIWIPINIHPWPIAAEPPKSVRWLTDYAIMTETRWRAYIFSLHCARHTCEIFARRCHMANAAGRLVRVRAVPRLRCNVSQTYNPQHRSVTLPVETCARY